MALHNHHEAARQTAGRQIKSAKEVADLLARCETDLRHHGRVELPPGLTPPAQEPVATRSEPTPPPPRGSRRRAIAAVCVLAVLGGVVLAEATGVVNLGDMVRRRPVPDAPEAEKTEPQPPPDKSPPSTNSQPVATVPADLLRREDIPLAVLATLGHGDPARAPADLVAVFGEGRFRAIEGPRAPAFSPDGSMLAVGAGEEVHLFKAGSGERLNVFGPFRVVVSVCFSPDGTMLAVGDRVVNLLDVRTGRVLHTLRPQKNNEIDWLSFTPDGRHLVAGSQDGLGTTPVWDVKTGALVHELPPLVCGGGKDSDGRLLVLARVPGEDRINAYSAETGKLAFPGPKWPQFKWPNEVTRASLNASGHQLALGKADRVAVWDIDSLRDNPDAKPLFDRKTPGSWLSFAHGSDRLWTAEFNPGHLADFHVRCWDPSTGKEVTSVALKRPSGEVWFALSQDDSTLFASSRYESFLQLYDTRSGTPRFAHRGHMNQTHALAFNPDGRLLASGGQDGAVKVWDVATGTEKYAFFSWSWIQNVAFNHDGSRLAARDSVGTVTLWRMTDGSRVWSTKTAEGHGQKLRFSPDGMLIALTTREGGVRFLRASDGSEVHHWPDLHRGESRGVAFSPDGTRFASAGLDGTLVVAEVAAGKVFNRFVSKTSAEPVEFTADGTAVLCGYFSPEPVIRHWNLKSEQSEVYKGHGGIISSLSLQGQLLASCGHDRVIRLWDLTDPARRSLALAALPDSAQPDRVAFSPDGRYLASANQDGTLHMFRLNRPGEAIRDWMAARQGPPPGLKNDVWLKRVEGLHGVNLFDAVRDRFRELNSNVEVPVQGAAIRKGKVASVDMNSSKVTDFSPLRALPDLQSLWLFETSFSDKDFGYIRGATGLRDLHCGYFFGVKNVTDKAVEVIREFKELESLDIWGTQLTDTGLGQLHTLRRLKKLILGRTRITDAGMPTLARFPELTELRLNFDNVSDAGLPPLKGLKLQLLALEATATSDAGLKDIAAIRSLRKLDLIGTKVQGPGLVHLKALPELTELWLDGTSVSGEGLRNLAELLVLETLGLDATPIGDDDLVHLKNIKRLKYVRLRGAKVTAAGVKKLAEELPNCAISSSHGDFQPRNR
ncbi:MAG: hypothetical protein K8U57_31000 [Planctomycetes bacterium]|nr:hypothetical protein [Planctomycetota bacterium]